MKRFFLFLMISTLCAGLLIAQSGRPGIIKSIESTSNIEIKQDPKLDKLLKDYIYAPSEDSSSSASPYVGAGYRVQVFSSNAQKTAKNESSVIEQRLRNAFPDQGVYRSYYSPFWKVRIGDFRTQEEAQQFLEELIKTYPDLRRETYTVKESKVTIR